MLKFPARRAKPPHIDLETVRETLLYMESDCRGQPGLERVAEALGQAVGEIDRAAGRLPERTRAEVIGARFLPARLRP